ncbi:uncharacterized protein C8R40DRAFT_1120607 [Lentinula edodes]|uniref:uncharacterized protein n=1 Tax=Lentinula edodes TaxID=5353 RepID=UPI001E8E6595|nr:uncharacterized protein C8R40DRAFT_1120607 [Lentinula edodes]KAH7871874.1 hypothetical protein C8R40DRAFT_1120607 [Lentinula edodes]
MRIQFKLNFESRSSSHYILNAFALPLASYLVMSNGDASSSGLLQLYTTDVSNNVQARIFSGPVDPPEKPIAASESNNYLSPSPPSPSRRSPRLLKGPEPDYTDPNGGSVGAIVNQDEELFGLSRPLTPENEAIVQNEPSSVLASRIMRAHDNPSPPPQSPEIFNHLNLPTLSLPFPLVSTSEDTSDSSTPASPPSIFTPLPVSELTGDESGTLISFETSTFLSNTLETPTRLGLPNNILHQSLTSDITPIAQPDMSLFHDTDLAPTDTVDEQSVADALVLSVDEVETINPESTSNDTQDPFEESSHKPFQRSTRPRRSTARYSIRPETFEFDASDTDDPGPSDETKRDDSETKISSPRRKTITLVPNQVEMPEPLLFSQQPRSRSPIRKSALKNMRELGSLSPSSSTILKSLFPPAISPLGEPPETEPTSTQPPSEQILTPARPTPPIRFTSPVRKASPKKFQLQPADLDNPNRTPARRIPIEAAVANGQVSVQKAARLMANGRTTTSSRPVFNIPSTDSPVRRVLLHDANPINSPTKHLLGSPMRSRSVEPNPVEPMRLNLKKRSESVEPATSKSQGKVSSRASPFSRSNLAERVPLPSKVNLSLHPAIPEEGQSTKLHEKFQRPAARTGSAPVERSHLRQPTSKIPRIGLKPYARPPITSTSKSQEKTTTMRMVDSHKLQPSSNKPKPSSTTLSRSHTPSHVPTFSPTKQRDPVPGTPLSLKRKRGPEASSPTKPTPVVLLSRRLAAPSPSPAKKSGVTKLRMVSESDGTLPDRSNAASSGTEGMKSAESTATRDNTNTLRPATTLRMVSDSDGVLPDRFVVMPSVLQAVDEEKTTSSSPPSTVTTQSMDLPPQAQDEVTPSSDNIPDSSDPAEPQSSSPVETVRRTTRSSRNAAAAMKPVSSSRPPSARRKNIPTFTDTGPFSGMTALALRTLTDSNTTKNKEYVTVLLKTEVVRREGARPESPGMNVKSISQKEKESKTLERNARADRRAKRDNSTELGTDENEAYEDEDCENDWASSPSDHKHTWGPGDEEDYQTPVQSKRLRLDEEISEDEYEKKRVKWDRGLYQEIYLDEIKPRTTHARITQESIQKGCLAPIAKARPLDTLGNLPNAKSPLKDIVPENIVVKKFVYDNDVVEPVTPAPAPVKTRSKSKKKP